MGDFNIHLHDPSSSLASLLLDHLSSNDTPFHFSHPLLWLHPEPCQTQNSFMCEVWKHPTHASQSLYLCTSLCFSWMVTNSPMALCRQGDQPYILMSPKLFSQIFFPSSRLPYLMSNADSTWISPWYLIASHSKINSLSFPKSYSPSCAPSIRSRCSQMSF